MLAFFTTIGKWLISNPWRGGFIAMALAFGYLYVWRVPHLESVIKDRNLTISQLQGHIAVQNAAVDNWKNRASEAERNQKEAMALADKAMGRAKDTITRIEKETKPTPDKECEATLALLRKFQQ